MADTPSPSPEAAADTLKISPVRLSTSGLSGAFAVSPTTGLPEGFSEDKLRELYRALLLPRMIEEKMLLLLRQGEALASGSPASARRPSRWG